MKERVAKYVVAVERHGASTDRGNAPSANRAYDQVMEALRDLRAMPDRGEAVLLELTSHQNDWVRVAASTHLLPLNEEQALATLEKLTASANGFVSTNAEVILKEWRAGRFNVP
jgi:hypothetical protein